MTSVWKYYVVHAPTGRIAGRSRSYRGALQRWRWLRKHVDARYKIVPVSKGVEAADLLAAKITERVCAQWQDIEGRAGEEAGFEAKATIYGAVRPCLDSVG